MSDNTRRVFRVVIDTEGSAFEENPFEVARLLHNLADTLVARDVTDAPSAGEMWDYNGNRAGSWSLLNESHADRVRALEMELER